jgi:hypothetical protein
MEKQMRFKSEQRERTEFSPPVESSPLLPKEIKASCKKKEEEKERRSLKKFFF